MSSTNSTLTKRFQPSYLNGEALILVPVPNYPSLSESQADLITDADQNSTCPSPVPSSVLRMTFSVGTTAHHIISADVKPSSPRCGPSHSKCLFVTCRSHRRMEFSGWTALTRGSSRILGNHPADRVADRTYISDNAQPVARQICDCRQQTLQSQTRTRQIRANRTRSPSRQSTRGWSEESGSVADSRSTQPVRDQSQDSPAATKVAVQGNRTHNMSRTLCMASLALPTSR